MNSGAKEEEEKKEKKLDDAAREKLKDRRDNGRLLHKLLKSWEPLFSPDYCKGLEASAFSKVRGYRQLEHSSELFDGELFVGCRRLIGLPSHCS